MNQPPPALKEAPAPSGVFVSTITALKNGLLVNELDDALRTVTEAVSRTQLKGSIKINLQIHPNGVGLGDEPVYSIITDVDPVVPKKPEKGQTFFADEHFNLIRRNPKQTEDPRLTVVTGPQGQAKATAKVVNS